MAVSKFNCNFGLVRRIANSNKSEAVKLLRKESPELEITKSLLNLLHNIHDYRVSITTRQDKYFETKKELINTLLNDKLELIDKKKLLENNSAFLVTLAATCPIVAGL